MKVAAIAAAVALLVLFGQPSPASACSIPAPEPLEEVLEKGETYHQELVGVHEQRHIVRFPNVLNVFGDRSASVVTQYWGESPNLSVASHGAEGIPLLAMDDCGTSSMPAGFTSAHANDARNLERARGSYPNLAVASGEYGGPLAVSEIARLDAYFGPATSVALGVDDYVVAYAHVLWRPLLTLGVLGGIAYAVRARLRGLSLQRERNFDGPTTLASFIGVTAIALAIESFGFVDWLGLLMGLGLSIGMASVMRVPWALLGIGYLAYNALLREWFYLDLGAGDTRLHVAIGALIIGAGSLVWSRKHWVRFPAAFVVLAGTFFFVLGAAEVRGYRNTTKGVALASIVTGATGMAVWWLVFRERLLSSGAPAEPPGETAVADQPQPSR